MGNKIMTKRSRLKVNKNGSCTLYVPAGQYRALLWILSEGQIGLIDMIDDGQFEEDEYEWGGFFIKK
jgi:hypothetical protein